MSPSGAGLLTAAAAASALCHRAVRAQWFQVPFPWPTYKLSRWTDLNCDDFMSIIWYSGFMNIV